MEPASIRYKNPGAMWGISGKRPGPNKNYPTTNKIALKYGSKTTYYLSDGMGQGNNIAVFDTWVQGICAQLELWRTSDNYRNKTFLQAITKWSGGNYVPSYVKYVKDRVPGITESTVLNDAFWLGPMGILFLKAQAGHEAGKAYPAPEGDWAKARDIVFGKVKFQTAPGVPVVDPESEDPINNPLAGIPAAKPGFWASLLNLLSQNRKV